MKPSLFIHRAAFTVALVLTTASTALFAQGINRGVVVPLRAVDHAARPAAKAHATMACGNCRQVAVAQPQGIRAWFTPDRRHGCPSCRTAATLAGAPGRTTNLPKPVHRCDGCGKAAEVACPRH